MLTKPIIQLQNICKSFTSPEGQDLLVLDNINLQLNEGEIVALLGKSGSGKSTLLRIMAGLTKPSTGKVLYAKQPIVGPAPGISMVFQSFALLPWLTVLENVELGLEAKGFSRSLRRQKALQAIDTIGMDGFESAYPKELSGGMKQRVGFARALVVEPECLLMDEAFSALDILTSENLRNDLLDLWKNKKTPIKNILCVTHDIEEAVLMADRIVIFASNPGRIQDILRLDLPYPRNSESAKFKGFVDKIYTLMTKAQAKPQPVDQEIPYPDYAQRLPDVSVSELNGLLEAMESYEVNGIVNLPELAEDLHLDINNLFPLTDALALLQFVKISHGDLVFLEAGKQFAKVDILERKKLFSRQLLTYIPLAEHILKALDKHPNHRISENVFLIELQEFLNEEEAERLLKVIIDWGRYAEIFAYDYDAGILSLENPE